MEKTNYTRAFMTPMTYMPQDNLKNGDIWTLALDIGYSGVKGMSPNSTYCFPAFAREQEKGIIGTPSETDIIYKDENGKQWLVGSLAQSLLRDNDTTDSHTTLYERNRYFSEMFLVLARVGMALGLRGNIYGKSKDPKDIFFQTGLPPAYLEADSPLLIDALEGHHSFSVKFGQDEWERHSILISRNRIHILEQPMGAVFSASKRDDGTTVSGPSGQPIVNDRILVLDGGFGTLDAISIFNRLVEDNMNSFSDLGMKAVIGLLSDKLLKQHGVEVSVHAMQKVLDDGHVIKTNKRTRVQDILQIEDILRACNKTVCESAMNRIDSAYDYLSSHRYLLLAGGTCAAWKPIIMQRYAKMSGLSIISADQNDNLGPVFSNVRGYYLFRVLKSSGR